MKITRHIVYRVGIPTKKKIHYFELSNYSPKKSMWWHSTHHNGKIACHVVDLKKSKDDLWVTEGGLRYKPDDGMGRIFNRAYRELIDMYIERELLDGK